MSQLWTEIFNSNRWIPPALSRLTADGTASDCYAISIKGAEIPKLDSHCQYQLRACFYDAAYHTFFGKPWQSRWIDGRQRLTFDETLFFHTKFKEQAVVVVLELVARNVAQAGPNNDTPTSSAEQLVGWTVVRHYKLGRAIVDFSHQGPQFTKYLLNAGTPKILLLIQEPIDDNPQLLKSAGNIDVAIQTHRLLARALDFVPDNSIFGFMDIVPGLESAKRGSALANPVPREPAPSCVDSLSVTFGPHAERLEAELCDLINRDRLFKDNKRLADHKDDEMVVLERRIRIGIHNGWTYIQEPLIFHLSSEEQASTHSLRRKAGKMPARSRSLELRSGGNVMYVRNRVDLNALFADPGLAVIFALDFVVAVKSNEPNPPSQSLIVCWAAWSPFGQELPEIHEMITLPLLGGPSPNPDDSLCFKNLIRIGANNRIRTAIARVSIQFSFALKSQLTEEMMETQQQPHSITGKPIKPKRRPGNQQQRSYSPSPRDEVVSTDASTPAPPSRTGRPPLLKPKPSPQTIIATGLVPGRDVGPASTFQPSFIGQLGHMVELHSSQWSDGASIVLLQQHAMNVSAIPRATFAILSQADFPPIQDRHGDRPELVDPASTQMPNIQVEMNDRLDSNEIILQFLAIASPPDMNYVDSNLPERIFLTFQFYRFPQINTEKLQVALPDKPSPPFYPNILRRVDKTGSTILPGGSGFMVKFTLDPQFMKPGERQQFINYLINHSLHIDVWDADSLMLVGSALLPLRQLCRRSHEAVQAYAQLPIVTTELRPNQSIYPILRAVLYARMANVGYPATRAGGLGLTISSRNSAVISQSLLRKGLTAVDSYRVRAHPLTPSHQTALQRYVTAQKLEIDNRIVQEISEDTRRKLNRMDNIRLIEFASKSVAKPKQKLCYSPNCRAGFPLIPVAPASPETQKCYSYDCRCMSSLPHSTLSSQSSRTVKETQVSHASTAFKKTSSKKELFSHEIESYKMIRLETKPKMLLTALLHSITTVHTIFPSLGSVEFMEYLVQNPFPEAITVDVDISDPELSVVTDPVKWQHFKRLLNLQTPLEQSMFLIQGRNQENFEQGRIQLFLKPKEALYVPFTYQTFSSGIDRQEIDTQGGISSNTNKSLLLEAKTIRAVIKRADNSDLLSVLLLQVEPHPHTVHQVFRFYHEENSFMTKLIRLSTDSGIRAKVRFVKSTDPTVIAEIRNSPDGYTQDLFIKAGCSRSPLVRSFFVLLYADSFLSAPVNIWQFCLHSLQRVDISAIQGQTTTFSLVFKSDESTRSIRVFSSAQSIALHPWEPFLSHPGAITEISARFTPNFTGEKTFQINAVDIELNQLIRGWLVCASVREPNITKAYQITVPVGLDKGLNKRISFNNRYSIARTFRIAVSRPDLVQIKDDAVHLLANGTGTIGLKFWALQKPQIVDILLFINDEQGNNEETFSLKTVYAINS